MRLGILLLILTVVGQIPIRGMSVENRYHQFVNSRGFQKAYWTLVTPFTWTGEKITKLFEKRNNFEVQSR